MVFPMVRDSTLDIGIKISRFRRIPLALRGACFTLRRIRLVAYGARLESVLGASPRGFESPILRSTSPGSQRIPGFFLCLQRFWAVCIETDIYRLVRLGALKVAPIRPHQFEVRPYQRSCLPVSSGMSRAESFERASMSRGRDIASVASIL